MAKKVKIAGVDDVEAKEAANEAVAPEIDEEGDAQAAAEPGAEEIGAPATEEGPSMEDLVPDIEAALSEEPDDDPVSVMKMRIAELEAEKVELRDRLLRALAETENTRRRAERDRKDAESYGGTRLARDLLAVYDNLERALAAADETIRTNHGAFLEGVELTRRELENAFGKHKIQKVHPEPGEKFDPNRHQAMFEAPVPGAANGTVLEVMAPGFMIAERLLRPAMVGVARAAPEPKPSEAPVEDAQPPKGETQTE